MGLRRSTLSWFQTAFAESSAANSTVASAISQSSIVAVIRRYSSTAGVNVGEHLTRLAPTGLPSPSQGDLRATLTFCRSVQHAAATHNGDIPAAGFGPAPTAAVAPSTASPNPGQVAFIPGPPAAPSIGTPPTSPLRRNNNSVLCSMSNYMLGRSSGRQAVGRGTTSPALRAFTTSPACQFSSGGGGSGAGEGGSGGPRDPTTIRNFAIIGKHANWQS